MGAAISADHDAGETARREGVLAAAQKPLIELSSLEAHDLACRSVKRLSHSEARGHRAERLARQ